MLAFIKFEGGETMMAKIANVFNMILIITVGIGIYYMFLGNGDNGVFSTSGIYNLKYFTVLSNCLCGLIALVTFMWQLRKKKLCMIWKYIAATEMGLTFFIIACFLQPMYPNLNMYAKGNFWFHLICPLVAMIEFVVLSLVEKKIPFVWSFIPVIPVALYGSCYFLNTMLNGTGKWPNTNDFYGFLNWGVPVGMIIFGCIMLISWMIALLLRIPNVVVHKIHRNHSVKI